MQEGPREEPPGGNRRSNDRLAQEKHSAEGKKSRTQEREDPWIVEKGGPPAAEIRPRSTNRFGGSQAQNLPQATGRNPAKNSKRRNPPVTATGPKGTTRSKTGRNVPHNERLRSRSRN